MTNDPIERLRREITLHKSNQLQHQLGYTPLFTGSRSARIVIIGQAPGIRAQTSGKPWDDASGARLMQWLGIGEEQFRDERVIAHMPMDFYYPGKGKSGDLPPRKTFAPLWHAKLFSLMPNIELTLLIGRYAQRYYLTDYPQLSLTATVRNYQDYLPRYFPLVHPSPLNFRWLSQNKWFEAEVVPALQHRLQSILR